MIIHTTPSEMYLIEVYTCEFIFRELFVLVCSTVVPDLFTLLCYSPPLLYVMQIYSVLFCSVLQLSCIRSFVTP